MKNILHFAINEIGVTEQIGAKHNQQILTYAKEAGFPSVKDDETAWCSIFLNWVAKKSGVKGSNKMNARSWLTVGTKVTNPEPGDVVVYWRESIASWKGHVGIFMGFSKDGSRVYTLGGNCYTTGTEVQSIVGTGLTETFDFDVHSYDFILSQDKKICKIGYKSNNVSATLPYQIKILQGSTILYNQSHTFSNGATSYVSLATSINLTAGVTYTIERIQLNPGSNHDGNIGQLKFTSTFPANNNFMSIVSSKFYFVSTNGTSVINNTAIPFIDIVFEQ